MENHEFKKIGIKSRSCYYFDDIFKLKGFDLDNILINKKLYKNILISYKILIHPKPLRIRFFKIDKFIRIFDGTRYLALFGCEKYHAIYNKIGYLISLKSGITYIFSNYFAKIKVDSYDYLPIEKRLTSHNVINKSVLNKDNIHYYFKIFLEKCSYQLANN